MKVGEVWLVNYPFSDLSGGKLRPALMISKHKHNKDSNSVILCSITTNPNRKSVAITQENLKSGTLYEDSYIAYDTLFSLSKIRLYKRIFTINQETVSKVKEELNKIIF